MKIYYELLKHNSNLVCRYKMIIFVAKNSIKFLLKRKKLIIKCKLVILIDLCLNSSFYELNQRSCYY